MPNKEHIEHELERDLAEAPSMAEEPSAPLAGGYFADDFVSDEPMSRGLSYPQLGRPWNRTKYIEQVRARLAFLLTINIPLSIGVYGTLILTRRASMEQMQPFLVLVVGPLISLVSGAVGYFLGALGRRGGNGRGDR